MGNRPFQAGIVTGLIILTILVIAQLHGCVTNSAIDRICIDGVEYLQS